MSKPSGFVFRRPTLASSIADGLVGVGIQDFTSGLFLAAPRRTGQKYFSASKTFSPSARLGVG